MPKLKVPFEEASTLKGRELGVTGWREVTQEVINRFAEATGDTQWLHVDVERAVRESPFRRTVAHGYFTLSLVPVLFWELLEVTGARMVLNYGTNKVRWPAPVPIPARVRMHGAIKDVVPLEKEKGFDLLVDARIEVEGQQRPAMAAEIIYRYYP